MPSHVWNAWRNVNIQIHMSGDTKNPPALNVKESVDKIDGTNVMWERKTCKKECILFFESVKLQIQWTRLKSYSSHNPNLIKNINPAKYFQTWSIESHRNADKRTKTSHKFALININPKSIVSEPYFSLGLGVLRTLSLSSISGPLSLWLYTSRLSYNKSRSSSTSWVWSTGSESRTCQTRATK